MEKISWTDHVRKEVLLRVSEQRNILHMYTNIRLHCTCTEI
jgi:hypothetical protein